jgi:segregation and condensation protein B
VLGRPNLYVTTDYFLDYMGINSLEELPDVSDLEIVQEETELFLERNELENEN